MARQKKEPPLSIRFDAHTLEGLARIEEKTGKGKAEIVRQSVNAVLNAFESDGDLKFPVVVVSAGGPQLTEETIRRTMERLFREQAEAKALSEDADFLQDLFASPPPMILKVFERYTERGWGLCGQGDMPPQGDFVASAVHNGQTYYGYVELVDRVLGERPTGQRPNTIFLLQSVRVAGDFSAKIVQLKRPFGKVKVEYVIAREWPYTDMPKPDTYVIYETSDGKDAHGLLWKRKGRPGEPVDSKGQVYAVVDPSSEAEDPYSEDCPITRDQIKLVVWESIVPQAIIPKPRIRLHPDMPKFLRPPFEELYPEEGNPI